LRDNRNGNAQARLIPDMGAALCIIDSVINQIPLPPRG